MNRRELLYSGGYALQSALQKPRRVGLIGCGWYGKCDLFRLIQVAPVEVVSLCDVDKNMLTQAAGRVADRARLARRLSSPVNVRFPVGT